MQCGFGSIMNSIVLLGRPELSGTAVWQQTQHPTSFLFIQASAEKEMKESDRIFTSLIHAIKERQTEVNGEIKEKERAVVRRAEELISELEQEIIELQRRGTELEELKNTEDHLHLLQVQLVK